MYLVTILKNVLFHPLHAVWVVNQLFHSFRQFHFAKKGSLVYFPDQLNYLWSFFFYEIKFSKKSLYALSCLTFFFKNTGVGWRRTPPTHTPTWIMEQLSVSNAHVMSHGNDIRNKKKKSKNFLNLSFLHRYFLEEVAKSKSTALI